MYVPVEIRIFFSGRNIFIKTVGGNCDGNNFYKLVCRIVKLTNVTEFL